MIITLRHGDSFDVLEQMDEASVAACVCDPPYGILFMGKGWDNLSSSEQMQMWHTEWLRRVHRVLKPGGVIKAFSASRTFHRLAAAMEDAGFNDIQLEAWAYGQGFPKSLNVSKALDKMHGAKRGTVKTPFSGNGMLRAGGQNTRPWMEEALKKGFHEAPEAPGS